MICVQTVDALGGTVSALVGAKTEMGVCVGLFEIFGEGHGFSPTQALVDASTDAQRQIDAIFKEEGATRIQTLVRPAYKIDEWMNPDIQVKTLYRTTAIFKRTVRDGYKVRVRNVFILFR